MVANGACQYFFTGMALEQSESLRRNLIAFDVAAGIPAGATVTVVTLKLNMSRTIVDEFDVNLHRVSTNWNQGTSDQIGEEGGLNPVPPTANDATWIHGEFDAALWNTPGGNFESAASATTPADGVGSYSSSTPQLVADVQSWLADPTSNFGWILIGDETTPSTKRLDSRGYSNADNRPEWKIDFEL
ncbi:DNRLRE domain-containing protein [Stieleria neptunia]|nr:DNRLRE domain-containing protein [Stieleria neptunia]